MPPYIEHSIQNNNDLGSPTSFRKVHHIIHECNSSSETGTRANKSSRMAPLSHPIPFPELIMMHCNTFPASACQVYDPSTCSYLCFNDQDTIVVSDDCHRAYLLENVLQKAIYGHVCRARLVCVRDDRSFELVRAYEGGFQEYAIKCMDFKSVCRNSHLQLRVEDALKECAAMQFMQRNNANNQHVMSMEHEVMCDGNFMYMVMPYMAGGEMFQHLQDVSGCKFEEHEARYWMNQIIAGVHSMHKNGIAHRDLSLENILLDKSGRHCKIIDFGMAIQAPKDRLLQPQGPFGKAFYMSPEVYHNTTFYDPFATDVWSLGVVLFMMIVGSAPFERPDSTTDDCFRWVTGGSRKLQKLLSIWNVHISDEGIHLLSKMLCEDPAKRISLEGVMSHPWIIKQFQAGSHFCKCM